MRKYVVAVAASVFVAAAACTPPGQLGTVVQVAALGVVGISDATRISTYVGDSTCALVAGGAVKCWWGQRPR